MTTTTKPKPISRRTSNDRLLKLAAFLKTVPAKRFSYNHWVGSDWKGSADLSCGTTACALGWATVIPAFRRLGLRLVPDSRQSGDVILGSRRVMNLDAAERLFGLSTEQATYLFSPGEGEWNATPKRVARKIERFVTARELNGNGVPERRQVG